MRKKRQKKRTESGNKKIKAEKKEQSRREKTERKH